MEGSDERTLSVRATPTMGGRALVLHQIPGPVNPSFESLTRSVSTALATEHVSNAPRSRNSWAGGFGFMGFPLRYSAAGVSTSFGETTDPGSSPDRPPTTTRSPSERPDRISASEAVR